MHGKSLIVTGFLMGAIGVALGAFGAHSLETQIPKWYPEVAEQVAKLNTWETGVRYHLFHALALAILGIVAILFDSKKVTIGGWIMFLGTLIFSGSLYIIVLLDISIFGLVAALGGTLLIVGWSVAFFGAITSKSLAKEFSRRES